MYTQCLEKPFRLLTNNLTFFLYLPRCYSFGSLSFAAPCPWQCEISNNRNNSIKRRPAIKIIAFFDHQPCRSRLWMFPLSWARLFWLNENNNSSKIPLNFKSNLNIISWESITFVILCGLRLSNRRCVSVVILIFGPRQNRLAFFSYGHVTLQ